MVPTVWHVSCLNRRQMQRRILSGIRSRIGPTPWRAKEILQDSAAGDLSQAVGIGAREAAVLTSAIPTRSCQPSVPPAGNLFE